MLMQLTCYLRAGASQFWGGNSLTGNPCQRWLKLFAVFLARRSAGPMPGLTVESVSWACEGRHIAGTYGEYLGLAGLGLAELFRLGTCYE